MYQAGQVCRACLIGIYGLRYLSPKAYEPSTGIVSPALVYPQVAYSP